VRKFSHISIVRSLSIAAALLILAGPWCPAVRSASIEAVAGKNYPLSSRHGPWMIMVGSIVPPDAQSQKAAENAARELVYKLRKKGIPAYTFRQDEVFEQLETRDSKQRTRQSMVTAQKGSIGVLAGNYDSIDDKTGQQTLRFIKKFSPSVTIESKDGKKEMPMSLHKAFMTRNPLSPENEASKKSIDPLILKLNSDAEYSLLGNKGKYTLQVASFEGIATVKPANFKDFSQRMDQRQSGKVISAGGMDSGQANLDDAAEQSRQLVLTLRKQGIEAYIWHDRHKSVVTVGSFQSPNDPRIERARERFRAKYKTDPSSGQDVLVAESVQLTDRKSGRTNLLTMDPVPELMQKHPDSEWRIVENFGK
jgi:hypothetical protein